MDAAADIICFLSNDIIVPSKRPTIGTILRYVHQALAHYSLIGQNYETLRNP
ncbi:hypothetical protein IMCC14465_00010 [alpha proteobacterium IMCC14465]|uniref:Uncharacterized protein n=1 Tax=alpha proteobacterium IMCC14465 TaxID=1220535 RepID=J9DYR9_9PROT|nr:hypothetical protein IMCC14465_00010 [alpha proteobacterium IMCC14465]